MRGFFCSIRMKVKKGTWEKHKTCWIERFWCPTEKGCIVVLGERERERIHCVHISVCVCVDGYEWERDVPSRVDFLCVDCTWGERERDMRAHSGLVMGRPSVCALRTLWMTTSPGPMNRHRVIHVHHSIVVAALAWTHFDWCSHWWRRRRMEIVCVCQQQNMDWQYDTTKRPSFVSVGIVQELLTTRWWGDGLGLSNGKADSHRIAS